jgi:hypothetical protein
VGEEQRSALIDDAARRYGTHFRRAAKSLDEALREVRARGYALVEDAIAGVRTIAAPVWGSADSVIGAIGIGGLASRFTAERATSALPSLIAISDAVTGHYGVDPARIHIRVAGAGAVLRQREQDVDAGRTAQPHACAAQRYRRPLWDQRSQ